MAKVATNAAGNNIGRVNQKPEYRLGLSDRSGKTRGNRLLIAFIPRSHAKCHTGFTLRIRYPKEGLLRDVKQGFTWHEKVLKGQTLLAEHR